MVRMFHFRGVDKRVTGPDEGEEEGEQEEDSEGGC